MESTQTLSLIFQLRKTCQTECFFCQLNIPIRAVVKHICDLGCQCFELFYHEQIACYEFQVEIRVLVYAYLIYYLSRDFILEKIFVSKWAVVHYLHASYGLAK